MTPTPPSTTSSTGPHSPEEQYRVVRKRNRVPLSCYPCRTRKKCDRKHPCSNCTKREGDDTQTCSYAASAGRKRSQTQASSGPEDMQNRMNRLEDLVLSLMGNGGNVDAASAAAAAAAAGAGIPLGPRKSNSITDSSVSARIESGEAAMADEDASDVEELAHSIGVLKVDADMGKSMYIGNEHWHMILADIAEVKSYFQNHKKEIVDGYERVRASKPQAAKEGPALLLNAVPASEIEIRAELPPKSSILTLCSRYFNSMDYAINIIHNPTFQQQLKNHWKDPSKTPLMWLGLLYSILTLAMLSYHKVGDEPPEWRGRTLELAAEYRMRTVQCLIKADYTRPVEYTIETMLLYVFGERTSRWDADLGLWMITSLVVRVALRMGYQRDAKWFPSLSPFQAEMRRRTWALVRMTDIVFSHQVSLPSMIDEHDCDTQLPNNIYDDEFHPDVKELPPSRPAGEITPIASLIAMARLTNELGNILQATTRVGKPVPYDEIIRFDAKLRQIMQELPPHLKISPLEGSTDPVPTIIARFNIEILYQKIMCLLHRKYLPRARQNPRYAHSRRSAIEASLDSLNHLATMHRESSSNGRLRSVEWFIKSIATKYFTLPAMLIILDLHFDNMAKQNPLSTETEGGFLWNHEERTRMVSALLTAQQIWKNLAHTSMEAFKAAKVVEIMLDKIANPSKDADMSLDSNQQESLGSLPGGLGVGAVPNLSTTSYNYNLDYGPNPFAGNSSGFMGMDIGISPPDGSSGGFSGGSDSTPMSLFSNLQGSGSLPDMSGSFDWNAFENMTQNANWGGDQTFQLYGLDDPLGDPNAFGNGDLNRSGDTAM